MARIVSVLAVLTLLFVFETSCGGSARASISLVNNGYEGIVVAIAETVPVSKSAEMIKRIEMFFTFASTDLFQATYYRVYFRNITILVPKSWGNNSEYGEATTETFSSANVVIDGPEMDTPTTWTYGECGEPGEYMQLPIGYMSAGLGTIVGMFGYPGVTIVHEWGHLRWGLRDEYPVPGRQSFYHSNGNVEAVRCGKYMKGMHVDYHTGDKCKVNKTTGLPVDSCFFQPHHTPGVKASLMFYHNVSEVETFCDNNASNPETLHNDEAQSEHNVICRYRSAWEIMREHDDFKGGNSTVLPKDTTTTPTFRIVQAKKERFVMILDVSGSMRGEKIDKLYQTSVDFLMKVVPTGYTVGIVTFSSSANIVAPLTEMTSQKAREDLVEKLPKSVSGSTAIGRGLLAGVEVLEADGGSASGGVLLLVSDGEENVDPRIAAVTPTLVSKGVTVNTVLIGDSADKALIELAAFTKGNSFFDSGSSDSTGLQSALKASVTHSESSSAGKAPIDLLLESLSIGPDQVVNSYVSIDSSVGRDTEFIFTYSGSTFGLYVLVTSPSGVNYTVDGQRGHRSNVTKQVTISFNETEVGQWTIVLRNPGLSTTVTQLHVTSKAPSDDSYPITTRAFLSHQRINFNDKATLKLIVRAEVRKGYSPLIGAKVDVQAGSLPWKFMNDDGLGVDTVKNDGFYSATLLNFKADGTFPVKVRATAKEGNQTRLVTKGGSRAFRLPVFNRTDLQLGPTYEVVAEFDRTSDAGLIDVVNVKLGENLKKLYPFPPALVNDLEVSDMSYENKTVTLQWTAVGDYEDEQTASSYDLRFSTDFKQLRSSFGKVSQLDESDIIVGNLSSPSAVAEREMFIIRFPSGYIDVSLFFGLVVNHSVDRISDVSNIVTGAIVFVPPISPPTTSEPDYTTTEVITERDTTTSVGTTTMPPTTHPEDITTASATPTSPTTTDKPATTLKQQPTTTHSSADAELVMKLAVGSAMPIILIIIIAVVIKLTCSQRARRHGGHEEDGLRQHNLTRANMRQFGGRLPYSNSVGNVSVVGSQRVGFAGPVYLPPMNPYQVHACGHIPNNPPQYRHPPYYGQEFNWDARR